MSVQWESKEFVYRFSQPTSWVKVSGPESYTEVGARIEFWQEYQSNISTELQKWLDEGWQPVGEVGPAGIEIRTAKDHRDKGCTTWLIIAFFSIPTFGLLLVYWYFVPDWFAEPVRFTVRMRRPRS